MMRAVVSWAIATVAVHRARTTVRTVDAQRTRERLSLAIWPFLLLKSIEDTYILSGSTPDDCEFDEKALRRRARKIRHPQSGSVEPSASREGVYRRGKGSVNDEKLRNASLRRLRAARAPSVRSSPIDVLLRRSTTARTGVGPRRFVLSSPGKE
jgi:hypothetical protein